MRDLLSLYIYTLIISDCHEDAGLTAIFQDNPAKLVPDRLHSGF